MCNSIIILFWHAALLCACWQNIMSIVKGEEDRSESINWNVEIKGELTIENCFVIYDTHNMAVSSSNWMLSIAIVVDEIRFDQKRSARASFVLFGKMGNVSITIALCYVFRCHWHLDINGNGW